ncbi:MAG: PAS domain S-box protein [Haloferacaceae archaeon]
MRVLHVDDDPAVARLSSTVLERECENASVETTSAPETALDRLAEGDVDCVVSGYDLPSCDGVEFLRRVRDLDGDVPFVLFTGTGSEEVASEAISAGVTEYLRKEPTPERFRVLAVRVEQAVASYRTEARFEAFLESVPDATCLVDEEGRLTAVNQQLESLFGYDRSELVGERVEVLIPERDREQHVRYREAFVEDPERRPMGASLDLFAEASDGSEFPVDVSLSPIHIGGHVEVMAAVRDATERRSRQRQLERQNDRLEEFVGVVAHDLRNPLQVATGRLELARESRDSDHLDAVARNHDRMADLIDSLLTLARQGDVVGEPEPVDLRETVERVWTTVDTADATLDVGEGLGATAADPTRLRELFENLFRNAVDHVGADVHIRVGSFADGFYVEDDGPGVPEHEREAVFERGFTTSGSGTGLGLAIVRRIVEAHGWDVTVTEGRDGGARFEVTTRPARELLYAD